MIFLFTIMKGEFRMDFINDLGKKFTSVLNTVTEKTKESVEASQLNSNLKNARAALEQLYTQYGKACYAIYSGGGNAEAAQEIAKQIEAAIQRVDALTAQRDELNNVVRCPKCGAPQARTARFCSACGQRMPEEAPAPAPEAPVKVEYCSGCGAQREGDSRFCIVCGKPFEDPAEPTAPETAPEPVEPEAVPANLEEPEDADEEG